MEKHAGNILNDFKSVILSKSTLKVLMFFGEIQLERLLACRTLW